MNNDDEIKLLTKNLWKLSTVRLIEDKRPILRESQLTTHCLCFRGLVPNIARNIFQNLCESCFVVQLGNFLSLTKANTAKAITRPLVDLRLVEFLKAHCPFYNREVNKHVEKMPPNA